MTTKAYVLMAWPWEEVWEPVAVFYSKENADHAATTLYNRIHGEPQFDESGRRVGLEFPQFDVREVDLDPMILDTGKRRLMKAADSPQDGDTDRTLDDSVLGEWETGNDVYSIVTALERGDPEYKMENDYADQ